MTQQLKPTTRNQDREAGLSDYVFGNVPPQSIPLEEAVLGAILLDKDAMVQVLDVLTPESFYTDAHQIIFRAFLRLFEKSHPIDLLTVTEELKKSGELDKVGSGYYLTQLTNRVGSAANLEFHARIIQQFAIERQLIQVSSEIIKDAYDPTVDSLDVLERAEKKIFEVAQGGYLRATKTTGQLSSDFLNQIEEAMKRKDGLTGVPSGFTALDRVTNDWQASDLVIIAARPGMGKTAMVISNAINAAEFGKGVAVFSLEMSATQLIGRMASQLGEIEGSKLRSGKLHDYEWQQLQAAVEKISGLPIYIDDTPAIGVYEMRAKCRRLKMQHDIKLVIVDYLQLMSGGGENGRGNREQEISAISRALKAMAKELNVPVIALSQLSRAVETRGGDKRPILSDLRESGAIEQDADIVIFIYRPEYYGIEQDETGGSTKGLAEIIIAKHRAGSLDTVELGFIGKYTKFCDKDAMFDTNFKISQSQSEFDKPFEPTKILTTPSKMNDDQDIPF